AGDHVTTITVLEMLREWTLKNGDLTDKRLLDLGTGTGILAIAGYLYGIGSVTAADIEESAVFAAEKNFSLNGMAGKADIILGGIRDAGRGYDVIAANLFLEPLLDALAAAAKALNPKGAIIISGLLSGQERDVFKAAEESGLRLIKKTEKAGWVSAVLEGR
ncbi:MAG: 50S ribosomal protein L11 methyltransferase, partial [Nitrospirota bacterium]